MKGVYQAGRIKRRRATRSEMEERARFLIEYALAHGPVTVRGLYYQAEVAGVPGIDKSEAGYNKIQTQVLKLRQEGRLPYRSIADATRYMRRPRTFDGWEDALRRTAQLYRKSLWADTEVEVEIWIEKSALAGVVYPVTAEYDVALMPTGGFTSETFAYEAVDQLKNCGRKLVIYALYDFDRSGADASASLKEKLYRFGELYEVEVEFHDLALGLDQVMKWRLPTRPPKRLSSADHRWPHDFAAELDAIAPDELRGLVRRAIEEHLPDGQLEYLKRVEQAERKTLLDFIGGAA